MRIGRNELCPCGSGKKFKHCHGVPVPEDAFASARAGPRGAAVAPLLPRARSAKRRNCDGCQACCGPAVQINKPDIVVPRGEICPHVSADGCSRWNVDLPEVCKAFLCNYLVEPGRIRPEERPDRVGTIVQRTNDRLTRLSECLPDGLIRTMRNPVWGPIVRRDLRAGRRLLVSFFDDALDAEAMLICRANGRLRCALALCHPDGTPVRVLEEPVYDRKLYRVALLTDRRHTVDAAFLIERLGDRDSVIYSHPDTADAPSRTTHCFRRRQADLLHVLDPSLENTVLTACSTGEAGFPLCRPTTG